MVVNPKGCNCVAGGGLGHDPEVDGRVKAIACVVYILNRCLMKSVPNKTLNETCSGRGTSIYHLKAFECIAYAHMPHQFKKKKCMIKVRTICFYLLQYEFKNIHIV